MLYLTEKEQNIQHILTFNVTSGERVFYLDKPQYSIGRDPNNSLFVNAKGISRQHVTLIKKYTDNSHFSYIIIDGSLEGHKSKNGVLVNGEKIDQYELKHGDIIYFTRYVKAHYYIVEQTNREFASKSSPDLLSNSTVSYLSSLSKETQISQSAKQASTLVEIKNLASVVELSPIPIVEINYQGSITYFNPSANLKFPDLQKKQLKHPLLQGLINQKDYNNGSLVIREFDLVDQSFEQHIHYLAKEQLIRSYVFDITQRKKAENELKYRAFHDGLTGLPNRVFFDQHISLISKKSERHQKLFAILFFDIDSFKSINDTLGHNIGDKILQYFAQRLTSQIRKSDFVCRWGGDEFVVLLSEIENPEQAGKFSQRLLQTFEHPLQIEEHEIYLKCSIGISIYPHDGTEVEVLLKNADVALYRTKESGRNNYQFYNPEMGLEIRQNFTLENQLNQAIKNEELILYYQPQINTKTGRIYGLEALIRWKNPELGFIKPNKFIPIAEKTGLIVPIGEWVLETACQQNKKWQQMGLTPVKISVNLSTQQLQQPNLIEIVKNTLERVGLEPQWLELEVTESMLMKNISLANKTLQKLRGMGVYISMDDFGTGYSCINHLPKFPFTTLKVAQDCVQNLTENPETSAIVSATVALGNSLDLRVIAEGVENQKQLDILQKLDCLEIQGYLLSHPLNSDQATEFLTVYQEQNIFC
ncbi:EAL domain-containing protein [Crocosphaera sp. Alani8]|uniref:EAL domain-containing protein n=1 Tax=Crocosphaera sp. Alani8 TaxID=3038952 RepID=UPI00313AAE2F